MEVDLGDKKEKVLITGLSRICQGPDINVDDMAEVSPVNVCDLLQNIQNRYGQKPPEIFNMVGETLIIVNPYYIIPGLYTQDRMEKVIQLCEENMALGFNRYVKGKPHVYDVTMNTIFDLITTNKNQALVISGESGAGKTECAKLCMKFIAFYFGNRGKVEEGKKEANLEDKILACNPVLEAFGNAKTVRNNNSSRFGKYIKIFINIVTKKIVGAFMETYLLEKSRVCVITKDERNYHIFYQIIAGLNFLIKNKLNHQAAFDYCANSKDKLILSDNTKAYITNNLTEANLKLFLGMDTLKEANFKDYFYVSIGETTVPGIDDVFNFYECLEGLAQTGFGDEDINYVIKATMGILFVGNIDFVEKGQKCEITPAGLEWQKKAANLLNINLETFKDCFIFNVRIIEGKPINSPLKLSDCRAFRDTFAKELYNRVFLFLKDKMNLTLFDESKKEEMETSPDIKHIGLLDIFGFECFKENSFEQFCINYANEKLQNLYVEDIFKEIENMFIREGLKEHFKQIEFKDNQCILDAMGKKPVGIFFKLDDVCTGGGDDAKKDQALINKIVAMEKDSPSVKKCLKNPLNFMIIHTAKDVEYTITGFSTKNLDEFKMKMVESVKTITDPILLKMIGEEDEESKGKKEKYLGGKFRVDMDNLAHALRQCVRHYIRCLKPNEKKRKEYFEGYFSLQQIKYMGVLDTIRIRQEGYPIVKDLIEYYKRYEDACDFKGKMFVGKVADDDPNIPDWNQQITKILCPDFGPERILFGKTKVLIKQKAYDDLDKRRAELIKVKEQAITKIVLKYRGLKPHSTFQRFYKCIYTLQQNYKLFDYMNRINKYREICGAIQSKAKANAIQEYSKKYFGKIDKIKHMIYAERYRKLFKQGYIKKLQTKMVILNYVKSFKQKKYAKYKNLVHSVLMGKVNKFIDSLYEPDVIMIQKFIRGYLTKVRLGGVYSHITQRRGIIKEEIQCRKIQKYIKKYIYNKKIEQMQKAVSNFVGLFRYNEFHKGINAEKQAAITIQRAYKRRYTMRKLIQTKLQEFTEIENGLMAESDYVSSVNLFPNQKVTEKPPASGPGKTGGNTKTNKSLNASQAQTAAGGISSGGEDLEGEKEELDVEEEKVKKNYEKILRNIHPDVIAESSYLIHPTYDEPKLYFFAHILDLDAIINIDDVYQTPWSETYQEVVNHNIQQNTPIQIIEVGETHTALINSNGKTFTWGWNGNGQCAFKTKLDNNFLYDDFKVFRGTKKSNMVKMNIEDTPMDIDGGLNSNFDFDQELNYIKEENEFFSTVDEATGGFTPQDFENFYYLQSPMILDNYNVTKISCGDDFTMALDNDRGLCVFGANYDFQLGVLKSRNIYDPVTFNEIVKAQNSPVSKSKIVDMKTSGKNNILLNEDGNIILLSSLNYMEEDPITRTPLEVKIPNAKFTNIECGKDFTLLLAANGVLYSMGDNHYGQLGLGDFENRNFPSVVKFFIDSKVKVTQISCGYKHAAAKAGKGVYSWGCNANGQLGTGNLKNMTTPNLNEIKMSKVSNTVLQVSCGFRCTCFLTDNRQIFWCGTSGDIRRQDTPIEFDYATKIPELFSVGNHEIIKINHTWSRTMSVMYATVAETAPLKLKLKNNIKMNFLLSSLTTKWTTKDLYPPKIEHMEQFIADKHILKQPAAAQAAAEKQTPKKKKGRS
ncbi:MAG: hypothetical protein MJ252_05715 [archaeon]|nr:hypothetical protein [archaeon]